jgi:hypothetical protein
MMWDRLSVGPGRLESRPYVVCVGDSCLPAEILNKLGMTAGQTTVNTGR